MTAWLAPVVGAAYVAGWTITARWFWRDDGTLPMEAWECALAGLVWPLLAVVLGGVKLLTLVLGPR